MVSACALDLKRLPSPTLEEAVRSSEHVTSPLALPVLCEIPNWSVSCWQTFDVYEDIAVGNTEIAQINADIAQLSDAAYDHILSEAKRQTEIAKIREEMLEFERRDHFWDNVKHWIIIGLVGWAGVSQ